MCRATSRRQRITTPTDVVAPIDQFRSPEEVLAAERWPRRLLTIRAAAEYLGVSRATVERLVNRGELPIVKVAGSTRYDVEDLDGYIEFNRRRIRKRTA
jgi:excisionase family DNA binding protein